MRNRSDGYVDQRSRRQKCPACGLRTLAIQRRGDRHKGTIARCESGDCLALLDEHGLLMSIHGVVTVFWGIRPNLLTPTSCRRS